MKTVILENIPMVPVVSTSISKLGYVDNVLAVEFANGGRYIYVGVEENHYANMVDNAKSIGRYFKVNIKDSDNYTCIKV